MPDLHRRQLLQGLAAAGVGSLLNPRLILGAPPSRDLIRAENERTGTLDWQLTYTRVDPKTKYRSTRIEGYASRSSVAAGEQVAFCVSTDPPSPFVIDFYRLGYYQGTGGRHVQRLGPFPGRTQ